MFTIVAFAIFFFSSSASRVGRIVGGSTAKENSAIFMADIQVYNGSNFIHKCGGSIIHPFFVLTAGHCVKNLKAKDVQVLVGTNDLKSGKYFYNADKFIVHNRYDKPYRHHNDIALVRVNSAIEYNNNVQPIKYSKLKVGENVKLTLTGFGRTRFKGFGSEKLLMINLKQLPMNKCNRQFSEYNKKRRLLSTPFGSGHLCTFNKKSQGICFGDSGSPITFNNTLVAMAVAGANTCADGAPDIHIKVSYFNDWIRANIKNNSP